MADIPINQINPATGMYYTIAEAADEAGVSLAEANLQLAIAQTANAIAVGAIDIDEAIATATGAAGNYQVAQSYIPGYLEGIVQGLAAQDIIVPPPATAPVPSASLAPVAPAPVVPAPVTPAPAVPGPVNVNSITPSVSGDNMYQPSVYYGVDGQVYRPGDTIAYWQEGNGTWSMGNINGTVTLNVPAPNFPSNTPAASAAASGASSGPSALLTVGIIAGAFFLLKGFLK